MDSAHWQRLEEVFLTALEKDPADVSAFLDEATRGDPSFRAEVQELLATHARPGGLAIESMLSESEPHLTSTRVGPFGLIERIGRGGMGEVFRAERIDGHFEQTVAVKLIRGGFTTSEMLRRFRAERQILARLEHPHIARLLDGGVTDQGLPYLAMEYVVGKSIAEHCTTQNLSVEERLALFVTVCRAVQYAHQNLVVHRDLKPSNILVTNEGSVRLLDFGVAKLLDTEVNGEPVTARTVLEMMTPEYASPEQVRGGPITTATDVYALGLLFYELLTGRRAQERAGASLLDLERTIRETQAPAPSSAVTGSLRKRLLGDLDVIAATAMQKDPARRYASAEQLASDVERHLKGLPLVARPDTWGYRASTFLRRHRLAVGAAAVVLVSLIGGLALAVHGMMRAGRAETKAVAEAATSERIAEFLVDMFKKSDPKFARGETLTARELLDKGAERIEELSGQPVVQARLLAAMAGAYTGLGQFDVALSLSEREHEIQSKEFGPRSVQAGNAMTHLAQSHANLGDYPRSKETAEESLAILLETLPADSPDLMDAYNRLAIAHGQLGENAEARAALEGALAIREKQLGPDDIRLTGMLTNLAIVNWQEGKLESAGAIYDRVLRIQEGEATPNETAISTTLSNWALVHEEAGTPEEAKKLNERALEIRERLLAPDHPDIGESLSNLGNVLLQLREYDRAREVCERSLAIREKALGPDHPYVGMTLTNVGLAIQGQGGGESARPMLTRAFTLFEKSMGPDHVMVSYPLIALAELDERRNDLANAEARFRRAIHIREAVLPAGHNDLTRARRSFVAFLRNQGRGVEADSVEAGALPAN